MPGRFHWSARPTAGSRRRDWLLISLVVVVLTLAPRTGSDASADQPAWVGAAALVTALGQGAALVWRRRRPEAAAAAVVSLYGLSVLLVGLIPPLAVWVAIWTLANAVPDRRRALRGAGLACGATIAILLCGELARAGSSASFLLGAVTVGIWLTAVLVRSERGRLDAVRQASAADERLRIAADLHDLVGHGLSAIAVQSSTARLALSAGDSSTALAALSAVEGSSRTALREMRQLLGVLRSGDAEPQPDSLPAPGLADVTALVENIRAGGAAVSWETDIDPSTVSPAVQQCAYRVTQEAMTNAIKHSPGAVVSVSAVADVPEDRPAALLLRVETTAGEATGRGTVRTVRAGDETGFGIDGIHARVASVGGTAFVGATKEGWLVEARLPLSAQDGR